MMQSRAQLKVSRRRAGRAKKRRMATLAGRSCPEFEAQKQLVRSTSSSLLKKKTGGHPAAGSFTSLQPFTTRSVFRPRLGQERRVFAATMSFSAVAAEPGRPEAARSTRSRAPEGSSPFRPFPSGKPRSADSHLRRSPTTTSSLESLAKDRARSETRDRCLRIGIDSHLCLERGWLNLTRGPTSRPRAKSWNESLPFFLSSELKVEHELFLTSELGGGATGRSSYLAFLRPTC